jgi:hypothetical protein
VFVTSSTHAANFGGVAQANQICQALADAAGLDGTYLAWLSATGASPETTFEQDGPCWRLVDDTLVATDWADLTDGTLESRISLDQNGVARTGRVWTATLATGEGTANTCTDWTSVSANISGRMGDVLEDNSGQSPSWWSARGNQLCSQTARFYCFEQ